MRIKTDNYVIDFYVGLFFLSLGIMLVYTEYTRNAFELKAKIRASDKAVDGDFWPERCNSLMPR